MKISTGLRPEAELIRVYRRSNDAGLYYVETAEWSAPIVLPSGAAEVWIVTFYTTEDTEASPKDTSVRIIVLEKEPVIQRKGVRRSLSKETLMWHRAQDHIIRKDHSIPDDAAVSRNEHILTDVVDTTYEWYELTV